MQRPSPADRRSAGQGASRPTGRTTAVGPGDRRDGQPLIFGWGSHLTRAEKQKYRARFVFAGGAFIFALILLVIGIGALQQYFFKPRTAIAKVNGDTIEQQWYDKNLAYSQFVLQHDAQDLQSQFQSLAANQKANAAATATANPQASDTPQAAAASGNPAGSASAEAAATPSAAGSASGSPAATPNPAPSASPAAAEASGTPAPAGSPTTTPSPTPTFNPQESATVAALSSKFAEDQAQLNGIQQKTLEALIDDDLMRQNAPKLGINVSNDDVSAQAQKTTDQLGGADALKQVFQVAHLSQGDFNQIQYNVVLRDKFQAYFADHPDAAPTASATPVPTPSPTVEITGPVPPTATPSPTPVPTPGADTLERWLEDQRKSANISRSPLPQPQPS